MIRRCETNEFEFVWQVINDGAIAYQGAIPDDCWHEPYMPEEKLRSEIEHGVVFFGYEEDGHILGVMGLQPVQDVTLIRHAYVCTQHQRQGVGAKLLRFLVAKCEGLVLVGTWTAAIWAIRFYEKHGFQLVDQQQKVQLLERYWSVSDRQVEASVVLIHNKGIRLTKSAD